MPVAVCRTSPSAAGHLHNGHSIIIIENALLLVEAAVFRGISWTYSSNGATQLFVPQKCPFGPGAHSIISSTADKVLVPHTRIFLLNSVVIHCCKVAQGLKLYLVGTGVSYACHFSFCKNRIEQPPHTGSLFYMAFVDNGPMTPFNLLLFGSWLSSTLLHSPICTLTTLPASVTNFYTRTTQHAASFVISPTRLHL